MRKGSLQLSINAIVILIMAVAMLGVGIFFINSVLKGELKESLKTGDAIKEMIKRELQDNDFPMFIYGLGDDGLVVSKSESKQVDVGVLNTRGTPLKYKIEVVQDDTNEDPIVTVKYSEGEITLDPNQVETENPVRFKSSSAAGEQIWVVNVLDTEDGNKIYESQRFFITVQ